MYLQITTKCNMTCAHCCYSCTMRGKHGDYSTIIDAIAFARDYTESITIGGGEPTLHPRFFDILRHCLNDFEYVWMATNGSQTEAMFRLANIIDGNDYDSFERDDYCTCDPEDRDNCYCEPDGLIYQEDKLTVALSQDIFHDDINQKVVDLWTRRANQHRRTNYEVRNTNNSRNGIIAEGRAKKTGAGWNEDDCVCSTHIIKPDGKIKLCGCSNAPVVGDIWSGIEDKWQKVIDSDKFRDTECYKSIKRRK